MGMVGDCNGKLEVIERSLIKWLCPARLRHLTSAPGGEKKEGDSTDAYLQKDGTTSWFLFVAKQRAPRQSQNDINLIQLTKREAELADCQYKLLVAPSWETSFQERAESLKAELAIAHEENQNLLMQLKRLTLKRSVDSTGV